MLSVVRTLRAHGLCESALQTIYRSAVIDLLWLPKLIYASSTWVVFTTSSDRQKILAFIPRTKRAGFCASDLDDFETLCTTADIQLFVRTLNDPQHVLQPLVPPPIVLNYNLRHRKHHRHLPE